MRIAVLGCGQMAAPIIKKIHAIDPSIKFLTYTPSRIKAIDLANEVKGEVVSELHELADIDVWFLGLKPQQFSKLALEIKEKTRGKNVISILAGISSKRIQTELNTNKVLRVMPNTPLELDVGTTLFYDDKMDFTKNLSEWFSSFSKVIHITDEKLFDQLVIFSGSGPGFMFYLAECYLEELKKLNLESKQANEIISYMFLGAGTMMASKNKEFKDLRKQVTSKKGVTEAGLDVLMDGRISKSITESVEAAVQRTQVLAKE